MQITIAPIAEPLAVDVELFDEVIQYAPVPILVDFWADWWWPGRMAVRKWRNRS